MDEREGIDFGDILDNEPGQIDQFWTQVDALGIGKPIVRREEMHKIAPDEQQKMGVKMPPNIELTRLGHILACDPDETSHVIITPEGELVYLAAAEEITRATDFTNSTYYRYFSVNGDGDITDVFNPKVHRNIIHAIDYYRGRFSFASFLKSSDPKHTDFVIAKFQEALRIATEQKDAIIGARKRTRGVVVKGLSDLLGGGLPPIVELPPNSGK